MIHLNKSFTCPSCGKEKPLCEIVICEGSEVIQSIPIEETTRYIRYLQKKRIYKFRRCEKCNRQIKTQKISSEILRYFGIGLLATGIFIKSWLFLLIGILLITISILMFFLWSCITKIYPHTTYDRAKECDALLPIDNS